MAGQFLWSFDAPTGTYKNNAVSKRAFEASIANSKTSQFVMEVPAFGKNQGESVTLPRVSNLTQPTDATLLENMRIPTDTFSVSTKQITVVERGRSVEWTELSATLSIIDLPGHIERVLQDQMTLTLDKAAMAAFQACKIKAIPDGDASLVFDTDGTPSTTALVNLNYYHVEQIRDYLMATLNAQAFQGDEYFCMASTKALRGLKQDPKFEVWNRYTNADAKATGEVGKIEGIRFVEVNNTNVLSGSKGSGAVLGEAVFFGADAVAMAIVQAPEIRVASPADFGRSRAAAWYSVMQFAEVWDTANAGEARIVHVTSA